VAEASPESILHYSLFEFPLTILVSPDGRSEKVWVGEIGSTELADIEKTLSRDIHVPFNTDVAPRFATDRRVRRK
jgi:hypothetical protein